MPYADLREYMDRLEAVGELKRIEAEVDWNLELGAIMRRANDLREPALLFEKIKGYPPDTKVFANIIGAELPDDRPIDGIDQTDYLLGNQDESNREHLITFIGGRIAAVRWRQWRIHLMNTYMSDNNPSLGGYMGYRNETTGYPMIFNIEADMREMRNVAMENTWVVRPYTKIIAEYYASLTEYPNPPAANVTIF